MSKKAYLYLFLIVLNIFDCLTTTIILNNGVIEANPIMNFIIEQYSYIGMWGVKAILLLPIGYFLEKFSECFYVILVIAFSIIVTSNLIGLIL